MTDHDPMLDGIDRWKSDGFDEMAQIANAEYVLFSDLPALIEKVREDERERHANELDVAVAKARAEVVTVDLEGDFNYVKGYNDGLVEGDAKGRREGERIGQERVLIAWKEAEPLHDAEVRAECQRDERERLQQEYEDHAAAIAAAYTLMGAAIQNGIDAERKRIRFAIAALVDGDVIDLSLPEYRAVLEAIEEEEES